MSGPEPGKLQGWVSGWAGFALQQLQSSCALSLQVLRYFDYVFTGVFTFEMVIKVRALAGCSIPGIQLSFAVLVLNLDGGEFKVWFSAVVVQSAQHLLYQPQGFHKIFLFHKIFVFLKIFLDAGHQDESAASLSPSLSLPLDV